MLYEPVPVRGALVAFCPEFARLLAKGSKVQWSADLVEAREVTLKGGFW